MVETAKYWQALDARIAREVMGFEQTRATNEFGVSVSAVFWTRDEGEGPRCKYLVTRPPSHVWMDWDVWQPHKDVAQALKALETLSQKDVNYSIARFAKQEVFIQLWGYLAGHFVVRRRTGKLVRETICLASEAWLDAQELPSG